MAQIAFSIELKDVDNPKRGAVCKSGLVTIDDEAALVLLSTLSNLNLALTRLLHNNANKWQLIAWQVEQLALPNEVDDEALQPIAFEGDSTYEYIRFDPQGELIDGINTPDDTTPA